LTCALADTVTIRTDAAGDVTLLSAHKIASSEITNSD
jgi:hypothetical protein